MPGAEPAIGILPLSPSRRIVKQWVVDISDGILQDIVIEFDGEAAAAEAAA